MKNPTRARTGRLVGTLAAFALVAGTGVAANATTYSAERPAASAEQLLPDYLSEARAAVDSTTLMNHVKALSVDIGPRVTGTPAERVSAEYVRKQLEKSGYQVEFQEFPVAARTIATVTSSSVELAGTPNWQMSVAPGSQLTGSDQKVTANVIDHGSAPAADITAGVASKIVVADYSAATVQSLATAAQKAGAAALLLVDAGTNRPVPNIRTQLTGISIPVIAGGTYHAEHLRAALERQSVELTIETARHNEPGVNVIATRKASSGSNPEQAPIVMVTAHIDSVLGSPGANDDATGVSAFLETARVLAKYPSNTEIRIAGWGGEESGLLGSRDYANKLSQREIDRFTGLWQMDMVGTNYVGDDARSWEFWGHSADGTTNHVLKTSQLEYTLTGHGDLNQGRMTGSDHVPFHAVGIPAGVYSWMHWAPPSSFGLEPSYHRPSDTIDKISPERLHYAAKHITGATYLAAANKVTVKLTNPDGTASTATPLRMNCGDGWRQFGTSATSTARVSYVPSLSCTFRAATDDNLYASKVVTVSGDTDVQLELSADTTKPTVTADVSAEPRNGWYNQPVTVSFTATDDLDLNPTLSVKGAQGGWSTGNAVTVSRDGVSNVMARATDASGNTSSPLKVQLRVDTERPSLDVRVNGGGKVKVKAKDKVSGIDVVHYRVRGSADWQSDDKSTRLSSGTNYEFRATDLAGNTSEIVDLRTH